MKSPVAVLKGIVNRRFDAWLAKRSPPRQQLTLDQKKVFIFPSRVGLGFLVLLLMLLVLAINYQNNLVFALCFSLFSLLIVSILHTFANLSGIRLSAGSAEPVFAGELAHFHLLVDSGKRARHQLQFGFINDPVSVRDMEQPNQRIDVRLPWPSQHRGYLTPGRLYLRSDFPLGLIRCWSRPLMDWHCLVYPQPKMLRPLQTAHAEGEGGAVDRLRDSDEFSGFQRYQRGESPRRIHWKAYAKGQELLSKHYEASLAREMILDWDSLPEFDVEDRLSVLCAWALESDKRGHSFALRLPGVWIESGSGAAHLTAVLRELALFGEPASPGSRR